MKLLQRKPRDPSILEREAELMHRDYLLRRPSLEIELCPTRKMYALKGFYHGIRKNLTSPLKLALIPLDVFSGLVLSFIPGGFSRMFKDPQTGKYILRYEE